MNKKDPFFGSRILTEAAHKHLSEQANLVYSLFKNPPKNKRLKEILAPVGSLLSTVGAISKLTNSHDFYNETVMIARGFFERIVNICYLLACSDDEFKNYRLYAIQKAYRKLDQEFNSGDQKVTLKYSGKKDQKKGSELDLALKKFTTKNGKEINQWTEVKIPGRIELFSKKFKAKTGLFLLYQTTYYTDASESLHGSFYGFLFHTGIFTPGELPTKETLEKGMEQKLTTLLAMTSGLLLEMIKIIDSEAKIPEVLNPAIKNDEFFVNFFKAAMNNK